MILKHNFTKQKLIIKNFKYVNMKLQTISQIFFLLFLKITFFAGNFAVIRNEFNITRCKPQ